MFDTSDLFHGEYEGKEMSKPQKSKKDKNIFGVELEVNDRNSWRSLTETIENNIACIPYNLDEYKRKYTHAIVKPDCTAQYEIILQAERPRNLLLKLKQINQFLSPDTVHNSTAGQNGCRNDCSAHIHINNRYVDDKGIGYNELVKVTELLAPYLYLISGRDYNQYNSRKWAKSILDDYDYCDIYTFPKIRAKHLDNLDSEGVLTYDYHNDRYYIMNTPTYHKTSELRFFTNKCSFDYNRIKLFIEIAEFLVKTADEYACMSYEEYYEEIICDFAAFLSKYRRRREEMKKVHLDFIYQGIEGYKKFLIKNRKLNLESSINRDMPIGELLRNIRTLGATYNVQYDKSIDLTNINVNEILDYYTDVISDDIINQSY